MTAYSIGEYCSVLLAMSGIIEEGHLVDVAENSLLNTLVLDDLTEDTTVTTANDKNLLGVGVGVHCKMSDHLLVAG